MAELEKGERCTVVSAGPLERYLPDLRASGESADSSHSPEQGRGERLGDSFQTAREEKKKKKEKVNQNVSSAPLINHSAFSFHLSRSPCQG